MFCCNPNTYIAHSDYVECILCPLKCKIKDGESGHCRVRKNINNILKLSNYGNIATTKIDTLLSRPIYLWKGNGIRSLTLGLTGCNNSCPFCQNYRLSQESKYEGEKYFSPMDIIKEAQKNGVDFISFTFTEPIVWLEYVMDVVYEAKKAGIKTCLKTSGNISEEFHDIFIGNVDAMNIDIKPLGKDFYKECGISSQEPILNFIYKNVFEGVHVEISHMIIQGVNDNKDNILDFCKLVDKCHKTNIGIHLLKHYPSYKSSFPVTSEESMKLCADFCKDFGFKNVFYNDIN
jgi:pyruvate formate lyase activating enzyme